MYQYVSMADQSTERAVDLMRRGAYNRALRFFEHSFWLRHFPRDTPAWGCAYCSRRR